MAFKAEVVLDGSLIGLQSASNWKNGQKEGKKGDHVQQCKVSNINFNLVETLIKYILIKLRWMEQNWKNGNAVS